MEIRRLDREEAVEEGYNAGYDTGKLEGIQQNRTEMIINMYKDNLDIKTISKYANISIEEVQNIIKNNLY